MLFWGVGQGRDPLACTIQAPNLFLDSLPGHAPPSLRAQGLLGGSHGHSSQHCGTCSSCSTVALGITPALLTMGSKTRHSPTSSGPLSTSSPTTTPFPPFQPHWPSSPSLALLSPSSRRGSASAISALWKMPSQTFSCLGQLPPSVRSHMSPFHRSDRCVSPLDPG